MNKKPLQVRTLVIAAAIVVLVIFVGYKMKNKDAATGSNDPKVTLAQCLTEKGVKFYGASWCPHCAAQKKAFGSAMKHIDYVECAVPGDSRSQTQVCKDANIQSYPTWRFADGGEETGQQTLSDLAEKAGCEYDPNGAAAAANEAAAE
jgi:hypothetical protein